MDLALGGALGSAIFFCTTYWITSYQASTQKARFADTPMTASFIAELRPKPFKCGRSSEQRLAAVGLEMYPGKTWVVYYKDRMRTGTHDNIQFRFLFRPRRIMTGQSKVRTGFGRCITGAEAVTQQWFLEPVEMVLPSVDDITRAAKRNALRTGLVGTQFALHLQVKLMWLYRYVQMLLQQLPRWLDVNLRELNLVVAHAVASVRNPVPRMAQRANLFCSGLRGT